MGVPCKDRGVERNPRPKAAKSSAGNLRTLNMTGLGANIAAKANSLNYLSHGARDTNQHMYTHFISSRRHSCTHQAITKPWLMCILAEMRSPFSECFRKFIQARGAGVFQFSFNETLKKTTHDCLRRLSHFKHHTQKLQVPS